MKKLMMVAVATLLSVGMFANTTNHTTKAKKAHATEKKASDPKKHEKKVKGHHTHEAAKPAKPAKVTSKK